MNNGEKFIAVFLLVGSVFSVISYYAQMRSIRLQNLTIQDIRKIAVVSNGDSIVVTNISDAEAIVLKTAEGNNDFKAQTCEFVGENSLSNTISSLLILHSESLKNDQKAYADALAQLIAKGNEDLRNQIQGFAIDECFSNVLQNLQFSQSAPKESNKKECAEALAQQITKGNDDLKGYVLGLATDLSQSNVIHKLLVSQSELKDIESKIYDCLRHTPEEKENALAIEAREFARKTGDVELAHLYWLNAIEHSSGSLRMDVLKEYVAWCIAMAKTNLDYLEYVSELESVLDMLAFHVSPHDINMVLKLNDLCASVHPKEDSISKDSIQEDPVQRAFEEKLLTITNMLSITEKMLLELDETVAKYTPSDDGKPSIDESKLLSLNEVIENSIAQLWMIDRSDLGTELIHRIDRLPNKLSQTIGIYTEKHDRPIIGRITKLCDDVQNYRLPRDVKAPHQNRLIFTQKAYEKVVRLCESMKDAVSRSNIEGKVGELARVIQGEKKAQYNEYQKFVAHCCKLALDCFDQMNTGAAGYGKLPKNSPYADEHDYVQKRVKSVSEEQDAFERLNHASGYQDVYLNDGQLADFIGRKSGGPSYYDVHNEVKAFTITAIFGLYRIDQSVLAPETSRLYNDVFEKYYSKMNSTYKTESVLWMINAPKFGLELF